MGICPAWPARDREGCPSSHRAVNENEAAQALGMSVHWLRKDRRTKRLIPFFKLGDAVRYDIGRVREAIQSFQEGGAAAQGSAARYPEWYELEPARSEIAREAEAAQAKAKDDQ